MPTTNYRAVWTDQHGTTYEQKMELSGDAEHVAAQVTAHEAWVRENHDVRYYAVYDA